jgi:hypothetical protein
MITSLVVLVLCLLGSNQGVNLTQHQINHSSSGVRREPWPFLADVGMHFIYTGVLKAMEYNNFQRDALLVRSPKNFR